jgi:hypothetical protein
LLASIDRDALVGCRDYAMILALARLGLRSSEVVLLELFGNLRICQVSCYAASVGISRSTNRKNRVLHALATEIDALDRERRSQGSIGLQISCGGRI